MEDFDILREEMVRNQLQRRGIADTKVLEAMRRVPREAFVPDEMKEFAYQDSPLPIGTGQTISQPYIVALMAEALELKTDDRVLEIGTGSGYAAAILNFIAKEVYTVERYANLAREAEYKFRTLGYNKIHVVHGDGSLGWPEYAPYDAIVVTAGGPHVPQPLIDQLAEGGRLVIPIGPTPREQRLVRVRRVSKDATEQDDLGLVRFVPLVGAAAWDKDDIKANR